MISSTHPNQIADTPKTLTARLTGTQTPVGPRTSTPPAARPTSRPVGNRWDTKNSVLVRWLRHISAMSGPLSLVVIVLLATVAGTGVLQAAPVAGASLPTFSTRATDSGATTTGGSVRVTARVTNTSSAPTVASVHIAILAPNGSITHQRWHDGQSFARSERRDLTTEWHVPATADTGVHIVAITVTSPDRGTTFHRNARAGQFRVRGGSAAQPTTAPTTVPTTVPATATRQAGATATPGSTSTPAPTATAKPALTATATRPPATATAQPSATAQPPAQPPAQPVSAYRNAVLQTAGLAGYWRLGEGAGATLADASSHGLSGTVSGGVTRDVAGVTSGDDDGAMRFDGSTGYARVPNASGAIAGGSVSLEGWILPSDRPASHQGLFGIRTDTDADLYVLQVGGSNTLEARFRGTSGGATTLTASLTPGRWQHVAVTHNVAKSLLELYVDGKLRASGYGAGGSISRTTAALEIGRLSTNSAQNAFAYAAAAVDEVALYATVLPAATILDHIDAARGAARVKPDLTRPWLGAYVAGSPGSFNALDSYTESVGTAPDVVMWFQDWQRGGFNVDQMDLAASRNAVPMVTWMPTGDDWSRYTLARINAGEHDATIRKWARDAAAWGQPFFLRLAHEMNGNWYSWSPGVNGNTASEFITMWRRVHDIFRQEGATNVIWVWCPNVEAGPSYTPTSMRALYPGDAYVDWVGLDGYNWGHDPSWMSFSAIFKPSYDTLLSFTNKPMLIGETASSESGGNKAAWIRDAFLSALPREFPRITGVVWFNENKERDWRVNSSQASLDAYREAAATYR